MAKDYWRYPAIELYDVTYDVAILPDVTRPIIFGFKSQEIRRNITIES